MKVMAMRVVPPIRKIVQSKVTGSAQTKDDGQRRQHGLPSGARLLGSPAGEKAAEAARAMDEGQAPSPMIKPNHCQTSTPAIWTLAGAGIASIQRIGTMRSRPTGELTKAS